MGACDRRGGAQGCAEAGGVEKRWMDPVPELRELVQRELHVAAHVVEEHLHLSRVGVRQLARELQVDRQRDQALVEAVVQGALDVAAVGIRGQDDALAGRAKHLDLLT